MNGQIGNYIQHIIHLTPSQIKRFGKNYIIPQDYSNLKNKKRFIVFLTKTQIKKLDKAKVNKEKVDLKFSKTQFKKTFNHVIKINNREEKKKKKLAEKIRKKLELKNKPKKKRIIDVIKFPEINYI